MAPVPNGGGIEIDNNHLQYNKENISFDKPTTLPQHIYTHTQWCNTTHHICGFQRYSFEIILNN